MPLATVAEQATAILAEYLQHLAFSDNISEEIRELARIGSDVIAASMQADQIARWSFSGFGEHDSRPIGIFAMTRSSVYGLHYLYNIKKIREHSKMVSIGKFINNCERHWNSSLLSEEFGKLEFDRNKRMEMWSDLSEVVHIIPTIREYGGSSISHKVNFSFEDDLAKPSRHSLLPEYFTEQGQMYLEWRSKIAIGCLIGFRERFSQFYNKKALPKDIFSHLELNIWQECNDLINGIGALFEEDLEIGLVDLADKMFCLK
jgi:hypothetical protein